MILPPLRPLYDSWFRVETRGLENVPDTGGALVVANHSGTIPLDALMTSLALLDHHPAHRHLRLLGADLVFRLPVVAPLARKAGNTLACNADAERLLSAGELVGVWPEGFKGIGKPFSERYKLQRFGRGGFVNAALKTGVPIIPCSIVGAEETYPMLGNAKTVARRARPAVRADHPVLPLARPARRRPAAQQVDHRVRRADRHGVPRRPAAAEDPMLVFNLTDQVRETIQSDALHAAHAAPQRLLLGARLARAHGLRPPPATHATASGRTPCRHLPARVGAPVDGCRWSVP